MKNFDPIYELEKNQRLPVRTRRHGRLAALRPDEPCGHPGCFSHITHPCEGCGRIGGHIDEHQELRIGLSWYITGQFPAVPYEVARRIAAGMVEGMLNAVREAEREET